MKITSETSNNFATPLNHLNPSQPSAGSSSIGNSASLHLNAQLLNSQPVSDIRSELMTFAPNSQVALEGCLIPRKNQPHYASVYKVPVEMPKQANWGQQVVDRHGFNQNQHKSPLAISKQQQLQTTIDGNNVHLMEVKLYQNHFHRSQKKLLEQAVQQQQQQGCNSAGAASILPRSTNQSNNINLQDYSIMPPNLFSQEKWNRAGSQLDRFGNERNSSGEGYRENMSFLDEHISLDPATIALKQRGFSHMGHYSKAVTQQTPNLLQNRHHSQYQGMEFDNYAINHSSVSMSGGKANLKHQMHLHPIQNAQKNRFKRLSSPLALNLQNQGPVKNLQDKSSLNTNISPAQKESYFLSRHASQPMQKHRIKSNLSPMRTQENPLSSVPQSSKFINRHESNLRSSLDKKRLTIDQTVNKMYEEHFKDYEKVLSKSKVKTKRHRPSELKNLPHPHIKKELIIEDLSQSDLKDAHKKFDSVQQLTDSVSKEMGEMSPLIKSKTTSNKNNVVLHNNDKQQANRLGIVTKTGTIVDSNDKLDSPSKFKRPETTSPKKDKTSKKANEIDKFNNLLTFNQGPQLFDLNSRMDAIMAIRKEQKTMKLHQKLGKNKGFHIRLQASKEKEKVELMNTNEPIDKNKTIIQGMCNLSQPSQTSIQIATTPASKRGGGGGKKVTINDP